MLKPIRLYACMSRVVNRTKARLEFQAVALRSNHYRVQEGLVQRLQSPRGSLLEYTGETYRVHRGHVRRESIGEEGNLRLRELRSKRH